MTLSPPLTRRQRLTVIHGQACTLTEAVNGAAPANGYWMRMWSEPGVGLPLTHKQGVRSGDVVTFSLTEAEMSFLLPSSRRCFAVVWGQHGTEERTICTADVEIQVHGTGTAPPPAPVTMWASVAYVASYVAEAVAAAVAGISSGPSSIPNVTTHDDSRGDVGDYSFDGLHRWEKYSTSPHAWFKVLVSTE